MGIGLRIVGLPTRADPVGWAYRVGGRAAEEKIVIGRKYVRF